MSTAVILEMRTPTRAGAANLVESMPERELRRLIAILGAAQAIERPADLLEWLQGDFQAFLPHRILVAAWGDFARGSICLDVVSPAPFAVACLPDAARARPLLQSLFERWLLNRRAPYSTRLAAELLGLQADPASPQPSRDLAATDTVLVHGIKDRRGCPDCLYALFGGPELAAGPARATLSLLLPQLDASQRGVAQLPDRAPAPMPPGLAATGADPGLSQREREIMDWVGCGKTNLEIGLILDISVFTVKNHLKRIFSKLDVINRAQAVARFRPGADRAPRQADRHPPG